MSKAESKKLRIIFNSNIRFCISGYGTQMNEFMPLIRDEGYPLAEIDFYGLEGAILDIDGIKHYPKIADMWGGDALQMHGNDFKADVTITLQDIWVLDPNYMRQAKRLICYVPVDHEPIPPAILDRLRLCYRVIAPAPYAQRELLRVGIQSTYIPWTVDTEALHPMPDKKAEFRKALGIPADYFLFGMVAANKDNPPRKSFQEAMDAFKLFHDKHPKSAMYFHTMIDQQGGFPIRQYAQVLGINDVVFHPPPYDMLFKIKKADMAKVYNTFDCYLAPSLNEGFGVPIAEAESCGIPVITNNFTAMRDLVEDGVTGYKCDVAYKRFTPLASYVGVPDHKSIYEKMELIFNADREKMCKNCREFAVKNFDTKTVFRTKWRPFLSMLEQEIYGTETDTK
jgi:glycosyltransferase involved in cell wall biosynthesis